MKKSANLEFDLDVMSNEIDELLEQEAFSTDKYQLIGLITFTAASNILLKAQKIIRKNLEIIVKDYGEYLDKKALGRIIGKVEYNKQKVLDFFKKVDVEPVYGERIDEFNIVHKYSMDDFYCDFEKEKNGFNKVINRQIIRLENYYHRTDTERRNEKIKTWLPITISAISVIISIITLARNQR